MRHRQQLFLSINRIFLLLYAPLSAALSIFFFFTGNVLYATFALFTLLWLTVPQTVHRVLRLRCGQLLCFLYFIFILASYTGGLVLSLETYIPFYQQFIHLFGGFFFCILAAAIFCYCTAQRPNKQNLYFANLFCFCFSLAACVLWELAQAAVTAALLHLSIPVLDFISGLTACLIGASAYCILTVLYCRKNFHTYLLYAFEDFAALNIKPK